MYSTLLYIIAIHTYTVVRSYYYDSDTTNLLSNLILDVRGHLGGHEQKLVGCIAFQKYGAR